MCERMGENSLFSLTSLPHPQATVGVFTEAILCVSRRTERGQAPSKVRHWLLERGDSPNEEAIPGQAVFCPHVPQRQQTQGFPF